MKQKPSGHSTPPQAPTSWQLQPTRPVARSCRPPPASTANPAPITPQFGKERVDKDARLVSATPHQAMGKPGRERGPPARLRQVTSPTKTLLTGSIFVRVDCFQSHFPHLCCSTDHSFLLPVNTGDQLTSKASSITKTEGKVLAPLLSVQDKHPTPAHRGGFEQSTDTLQGTLKQESQVKVHV